MFVVSESSVVVAVALVVSASFVTTGNGVQLVVAVVVVRIVAVVFVVGVAREVTVFDHVVEVVVVGVDVQLMGFHGVRQTRLRYQVMPERENS